MCDQHKVLSDLACVVKDAEASQTTHLENYITRGILCGIHLKRHGRVERLLFGHIEVISTQVS